MPLQPRAREAAGRSWAPRLPLPTLGGTLGLAAGAGLLSSLHGTTLVCGAQCLPVRLRLAHSVHKRDPAAAECSACWGCRPGRAHARTHLHGGRHEAPSWWR